MIEVRVLGAGDEVVLERVAGDVFDGPVQPALAREFLGDPRHHLAVAIDDGLVVGMASGVHYVHPDKPPELWINEVGVAPAYRRRGLARRLLDELGAHGRSLGCREAWVLTERSNGAATALYRSVGAAEAEDEVVLFSWDLETKPNRD